MPEHVHQVLQGAPEPFAPSTLEKHAALAHYEPKVSLNSHPPERAERRYFNDEKPYCGWLAPQEAGGIVGTWGKAWNHPSAILFASIGANLMEETMARYDLSHERESVLADTLKGAVAGGIAVWVMEQVDWYMYNHEDPEARRRTQRVRPDGMDPAHVMANKVAGAFGAELSPRQPHPAGIAIHYALGIGPGALYGALQDRVPALGTGRGALFGLGLFLMQDELANAATGLSARPSQYPWQAHARGLVAHIIYGVVTDTLLRILKGPGRLTKYAPEERAPFRSRRSGRAMYAEGEHFDDDYRQAPPRSYAAENAGAGRMPH